MNQDKLDLTRLFALAEILQHTEFREWCGSVRACAERIAAMATAGDNRQDIEKRLVDALRAIAAHEVVAPLTENDDNVSLSDLPFYVAGKAHAEIGALHNIARNAIDAYEASPALEAATALDALVAERDALRAPLDKLEATLAEIGGCGDGNCCIHFPGGQHTNGGCRCVYATRDNQAQRHKVEKVLRNYQIAITAIRAALAQGGGE